MKIGFANGCFDLFHEGHRFFLTECRRHCDYLVVAVNSDEWVRRTKGSQRPHETLFKRMIHVRAFAEAVIPFEGRQDALILEIRPDVVFMGYDHGMVDAVSVQAYAQRTPGWKDGSPLWVAKVVHVGHLPGFSTTLAAQETSHALETDAGNHGIIPKAPGVP